MAPVVEVFADVLCPFTHVGLLRFVERRASLGRDDVRLLVRAWPLEVVNGTPLDAAFIAEEIQEIREQLDLDAFEGFRPGAFPGSSLPALAVANAAYRRSSEVGEAVSLELRRLVFEEGVDIGEPAVLDLVAARHGLDVGPADHEAVLADHAEGARRGVVGSPYFITSGGSFFCPALDVGRDAQGHLRISADPDGFDRFVASCLT
jgi:predicted DsbA family dithiol-disulfide isomerase